MHKFAFPTGIKGIHDFYAVLSQCFSSQVVGIPVSESVFGKWELVNFFRVKEEKMLEEVKARVG